MKIIYLIKKVTLINLKLLTSYWNKIDSQGSIIYLILSLPGLIVVKVLY